jgi:hypothetical protein
MHRQVMALWPWYTQTTISLDSKLESGTFVPRMTITKHTRHLHGTELPGMHECLICLL